MASDAVRKRWVWIAEYIRDKTRGTGVDVLNSDFVDDYVEAFGLRVHIMMWGANKCPQLGRDLSAMTKCGYLKRSRVGLSGNWQPGFPKWVWGYTLGQYAEFLIK